MSTAQEKVIRKHLHDVGARNQKVRAMLDSGGFTHSMLRDACKELCREANRLCAFADRNFALVHPFVGE